MKLIIVDDELHARSRLKRILGELSLGDVEVFDRSIYAIGYAKNNKVDVALLDIAMPEMNGIDLAKELKKINPFINVIFCTGYSEFMLAAIDLHASGYLLKPAETESVKNALDNLLHPVEQAKPHFFARRCSIRHQVRRQRGFPCGRRTVAFQTEQGERDVGVSHQHSRRERQPKRHYSGAVRR